MKTFIGNVVTVETNGFTGTNHYGVYKEYEVVYEDERGTWVENELEKFDEFDYTLKDIHREGGIGNVSESIKEVYNVEKIR